MNHLLILFHFLVLKILNGGLSLAFSDVFNFLLKLKLLTNRMEVDFCFLLSHSNSLPVVFRVLLFSSCPAFPHILFASCLNYVPVQTWRENVKNMLHCITSQVCRSVCILHMCRLVVSVTNCSLIKPPFLLLPNQRQPNRSCFAT